MFCCACLLYDCCVFMSPLSIAKSMPPKCKRVYKRTQKTSEIRIIRPQIMGITLVPPLRCIVPHLLTSYDRCWRECFQATASTFITHYWQQSSISKTLILPFSHPQQPYIDRFQWWERGSDTSPANI